MALPISNIPILTGVAAALFVENAKAAEENRGTVDFSRQCAEWSGFEVREPGAFYSAKNMEYLKGGVDELNSGKVVVKTLEEPEAMENG